MTGMKSPFRTGKRRDRSNPDPVVLKIGDLRSPITNKQRISLYLYGRR